MNEGNGFVVDIDNWFSNDPRLNEYLKTHDSISIRKELVYEGERRQGVFTFYKDRRDCMWTLTIEDDESQTIELVSKEND